MTELMEKMGLDTERDIEDLREARTAMKVVGYIHQYKKDAKTGKIDKLQPDEVISNEFLDVPDHYIRLKALKLTMKLKSRIIDKAPVTIVNSVIVNLHQLAIEHKKDNTNGPNRIEESLRVA